MAASPLYRLVVRLEAQSAQFISGFDKAANSLRRSQAKMNKSLRDISKSSKETSKTIASGASAVKMLGAAYGTFLAGKKTAGMVAHFAQVGDQIRLMQGRLNVLTGDWQAFELGIQTSRELGSAINDTANLFTKFAVAGETVGLTTGQINAMSKAVLQLGRVSGLSFAEVNYFSRQLAQGIGSGTFQGDELRSVRENLPLVAQEIARFMDESGKYGRVAAGDLKRLGAEGILTAELISEALLSISKSGRAQELFDALPNTFEQTVNRIETSWNLMIASMTASFADSGWYELGVEVADGVLGGMQDRFALKGATVEPGIKSSIEDFIKQSAFSVGGMPRALYGVYKNLSANNLEGIRPENATPEGLEAAKRNLEQQRASLYADVNNMGRGEDNSTEWNRILNIEAALVAVNAELAKRNELNDEFSTNVGTGAFSPQELESLSTAQDRFIELSNSVQTSRDALSVFKTSGEDAMDAFLDDQKALDDARKFWVEYGDILAKVGIERGVVEQMFREQAGLEKEADNLKEASKAQESYNDLLLEVAEAQAQAAAALDGEAALQAVEITQQAADAYAKWGEKAGLTADELERLYTIIANSEASVDLSRQAQGDQKSAQEQLATLQQSAEEFALLTEAFARGGIEAVQYQEALIEADAILKKLGSTATMTREQIAEALLNEEERAKIRAGWEETFFDMEEFSKQAARNMQDAFADFLFDPFADGLDGMLLGFINVLRRMIAEAAAAAIFKSSGIDALLGGILGGITGGGGSLLKAGTSFSTAPARAPGFGVFPTVRDSGGPGMAGHPYLIGRGAQPELFIPDSNGTFIPNADSLGGVGITFNIDARGADAQLTRALPAILEGFGNQIKNDIRTASARGRAF